MTKEKIKAHDKRKAATLKNLGLKTPAAGQAKTQDKSRQATVKPAMPQPPARPMNPDAPESSGSPAQTDTGSISGPGDIKSPEIRKVSPEVAGRTLRVGGNLAHVFQPGFRVFDPEEIESLQDDLALIMEDMGFRVGERNASYFFFFLNLGGVVLKRLPEMSAYNKAKRKAAAGGSKDGTVDDSRQGPDGNDHAGAGPGPAA